MRNNKNDLPVIASTLAVLFSCFALSFVFFSSVTNEVMALVLSLPNSVLMTALILLGIMLIEKHLK